MVMSGAHFAVLKKEQALGGRSGKEARDPRPGARHPELH